MVVIASIYFTPEIEHFRGIVHLQIPEEWLVSNMAITINIVIMILLTFVISSIANKYSLTTLLSLFPSLFFIMLQCCNPSILQSFNIGLIGATSVLVTTYYLFENYGRRDVEGMVFSTTFILCASTILWDKIIFFIPLFPAVPEAPAPAGPAGSRQCCRGRDSHCRPTYPHRAAGHRRCQ